MTADTKKLANRFRRSFRPSVTLKSAEEPCCWKKHFGYTLHEVIGCLEAEPSTKSDSRFAFPGVEALTESINKGRLKNHKEPLHKRIVEYALRYLEELGIVCRVPNMTYGGALYEHGFLVEPHDHACRRHGDHCEFIGGSLRDLFPANTEQVTRVKFYPLPSREERKAEIRERMKRK